MERPPENSFNTTKVAIAEMSGANDKVVARHTFHSLPYVGIQGI